MNSTEHDLNTRLGREAERFERLGGTPLDISQVLDRAGEIRRGRRMRATIAMAACVLAIAVPTALVAVNQDRTHEPTPAPAPKVDRSPFTLTGLEQGTAPKTGWFEGRVWHPQAGKQIEVTGAGRVTAVAHVGTALLVKVSDEEGNNEATLLPPFGEEPVTARTWPMGGEFAVSPEGNVVAFVQPNGVVTTVQDAGSRFFELGKIPTGSGFSAIAIQGENCSGRSEDAGCTVYATTNGTESHTWTTAPHDIVAEEVDNGLRKTVDVTPDGRAAGMLSATDSGSCWESIGRDLGGLWKTCDNSLGPFSPDGKHLLGYPAYRDGAGDSSLSVLDAETGEPVLHLTTVPGVFFGSSVWEDDSHVLAAVYQEGKWAIVRIGMNGDREVAVGPVAGDDAYVSPFTLPAG